jgi:thioredoxin reductase (NADPH)
LEVLSLSKEIEIHDLIIIGSGPAGLTAAIYTSRAGLNTLILAGIQWGGQLMLTSNVENFPGFPKGIIGPELMENMRKQAESFGATILNKDVTLVDFKSKPFKVSVQEKKYKAKSIIIATGASTRWLGLPSEQRLIGRGVSSCATCDAPFYISKKVVVVGGGDSALEEALFLSKFASDIKVIHRRDQLRASKIIQDRAFKEPKISFVWDSILIEVLGDKSVEGVKIKNVKTGEKSSLECEGVFIAIGHKPNTDIFKGQLDLDDGYYIVTEDITKTSVEGVFAAGDVRDRRYKQAVYAAGIGCKAAMDVQKHIEEKYIRV